MFAVILYGSGGELDRRIVDKQDDIRAAVLDIASGINDYYPGDRIVVGEVNDEAEID